MTMKRPVLLSALGLVLETTSSAAAGFTEFTDFSTWQAATESLTTITFTEIAPAIITTQYADLGVTFTDGNDFSLCCFPESFVLDGAGLNGGSNARITLAFDAPRTSIAAHYAGSIHYFLIANGQIIYESGVFFGSPPLGLFGGLTSTIPFDTVIIRDFDPTVVIDNLYFGPPIPGPGALSMLAAGFFIGARRRRRRLAPPLTPLAS